MTQSDLNDEDRKLIAHYREWIQVGMTPTWFLVGVLSVTAAGLVLLSLVTGAIAAALGFVVLGAVAAGATLRSTQRQMRLARLVCKLAALAGPSMAEPTARSDAACALGKAAPADRPGN